MSIEIRNPVAAEDYAAAVDVMSAAFLERPDVERVAAQIREHWVAERTWIAWDGPRACGNFRSWTTELTVPGGGSVPAAAVSAVTVLPTHRRRGVLTRMTEAAHRGIAAAGEPLAILFASEYPIYGRFGYGPATRSAMLTVSPKATSLPGETAGPVELAPLGEATRDAARAVFNAARRRVAGEIWRRDVTWNIDTGIEADAFEDKKWKGFIALHRDAGGEVDGYLRYTTEPKWEQGPTGEVEIADLHAVSDTASADLWRFILSVDLVTTVKAPNRPVDDPLPWLLSNARAADVGRVGDRLWVRILDLPRALEARAYERAGSLVLEVVDDAAWGGTRRWRLDAGPDGATCAEAAADPDLTVPIAALGAAYLGGSRLRDVVRATGCDEHREGALAEADALFRTADAPWCSTFF
jgi:predicted acetyltransferase